MTTPNLATRPASAFSPDRPTVLDTLLGVGSPRYSRKELWDSTAQLAGWQYFRLRRTQIANARAASLRVMMEEVVPTYTVEQYVHDLRAIRGTGAATAETSFYPAIDRLFNAAGATLKPKVLFSTQLRNQGAGMPDGFFPLPRSSRSNAEPQPLQNPERGVVEIKPATYSLDALATESQTLRYLQQYDLVLITNLREFRLLRSNPSGQPDVLERYTVANSADHLWHRSIDPKHNDHHLFEGLIDELLKPSLRAAVLI
jgi:hypothetical protein